MRRRYLAVASLRRKNKDVAETIWGPLETFLDQGLEHLTKTFSFSIAAGDVILLNGRWYVTHSGLIRLAYRESCSGISTTLVRKYSHPDSHTWTFRATVYKRNAKRG